MRATERRAQLLEVASELVAERGPQRARLADIAERAGVAKALLYRHFPSKQALLGALVDHHGRALLAHFAETQTGTEPSAELKAGIRAVLAYARAHPAGWRILFVDRFDDPVVAEAQRSILQAGAAVIAARIAAEIRQPAESTQVQVIAHLARNAMDGLIAWLHDHPDTDVDQVAETAHAFIWAGATAAVVRNGAATRDSPASGR